MAVGVLLRARGILPPSCARSHHTKLMTNATVLSQFATSTGVHFTQPMVDSDDELHPSDNENSGLQLKRAFKDLGHKYWGFTVYRCTYRDDKAWSELMKMLQIDVRKSVKYCGVEDLMESLKLTVHEDLTTLEGASTEAVRQHFKKWRVSPEAIRERQGVSSQSDLVQNGHGEDVLSARYTHCIHVDAEALQSAIRRDPETRSWSRNAGGYLNLVKADWALPDAEEAEERRQEFGFDDPYDDGEVPMEGCKMYDVGWMKVRLGSLMPAFYAMVESGAGNEPFAYTRPPGIAIF